MPDSWNNVPYKNSVVEQDPSPEEEAGLGFIQGATDFPSVKAVWVTSDPEPRMTRVAQNPFMTKDLWSTPENSVQCWSACRLVFRNTHGEELEPSIERVII